MRIVSIVPSLTHLVCELGLRKALVGCTSYCVEPKGLHHEMTLVGGTKDPDIKAIGALKPTHILTNDEENRPEDIAALANQALIIRSFPRGPEDVPAMVRAVGAALGVSDKAEALAAASDRAIIEIAGGRDIARQGPRRFLYFIWNKPLMVAGRDTYIGRLLELAGLMNAAPEGGRYPELTLAEVQGLGAELLFLASEPYPFRNRDAARLKSEWPEIPPMFKIDGRLMSWHGPMTLTAITELKKWIEGAPTHLITPIA